MTRALAIVVLAGVAAQARAETIDELEKRGADLAKQGHYSEAIEAFKQADRLTPRASHACLIALAYTRRELWPQAEVFFDLCHQRATPADPLPDWAALAEKTLADRMVTSNVAPVEIRVVPVTAQAKITVSSFAHDEAFSPRTIHVGFGEHVINASAPGYYVAHQSISVVDRRLQRVVFELRELPPPTIVRSNAPWLVVGAGVAIAAAGAAVHVFSLAPLRDRLSRDVDPNDPDPTDYRASVGTFETRRKLVVGLYAVGTASVVTGLVLRQLGWRSHVLEIEPQPGGGIVSIRGGFR